MSEIIHHLVDHTYLQLVQVGPISFAITKHTVVMWIAAGLTFLLVAYVGARFRASLNGVPKGVLMNATEALVIYVRDQMVYPIMGEETGQRYLSLILTLFLFIFTCNLLGLIPTIAVPATDITIYPSATATGNPAINFGLAIAVLVIGVADGIREHGLIGYLTNYVPHGVPVWIAPLMWPIEFLGTLIKHAVLAIRLMANMLAGHAVLFGILLSAVIFVEIIPLTPLGLAASVVPVLLGLLIYALEILVALIQAYVFALLSAIFLDMQVSGH